VSGLRTVDGRTPVTLVLVEAGSGERTLVPDVRGVPPIALTEEDLRACAAADWIHVDQTGYPALAAVRAAGPGSGTAPRISLDGGNFVDELDLAAIDLYAPTERALLARYPGRTLADALAAALAEGPALIVATRGGGGSIAAERAPSAGPPRLTAIPAVPLEVVSTLGAGDVFHGALLAALVDNQPVSDALLWANAAAALSCRALDGRGAIPDRAELERFLATTPSDPEVTHAG